MTVGDRSPLRARTGTAACLVTRLAAAALALALAACAVTAAPEAEAREPASAAAAAATPTPALLTGAQMARRIATSGDAGGLPYAVVDKRAARIRVFHADGRLAGEAPVLLGTAPGDHVVPGTGERTQQNRLRPEDRTTPAGRFVSHAGPNAQGERVIWVDPEAAFAIHRVRPGPGEADRHRRLADVAAGAPARSRASAGCVVVSPKFFDRVVMPVLGPGRSVVYVLPERATGWQDL